MESKAWPITGNSSKKEPIGEGLSPQMEIRFSGERMGGWVSRWVGGWIYRMDEMMDGLMDG